MRTRRVLAAALLSTVALAVAPVASLADVPGPQLHMVGCCR